MSPHNSSLPLVYMSESGHAFCPVCSRTLLAFSTLEPHIAQCAVCAQHMRAELEVAHYAPAGGAARLMRGRGGVVAAALGLSLCLAACEEQKGRPEGEATLVVEPEAVPTPMDQGVPNEQAPAALTDQGVAPQDVTDQGSAKDVGGVVVSDEPSKPSRPTTVVEEKDDKPFHRQSRIYGGPQMDNPRPERIKPEPPVGAEKIKPVSP